MHRNNRFCSMFYGNVMRKPHWICHFLSICINQFLSRIKLHFIWNKTQQKQLTTMKNLLRLLYEGVSVLHSSNESHSNNENKRKKKQIKFLFWMPNFAGIIGLKKNYSKYQRFALFDSLYACICFYYKVLCEKWLMQFPNRLCLLDIFTHPHNYCYICGAEWIKNEWILLFLYHRKWINKTFSHVFIVRRSVHSFW